jgi:hypothetical protein
MMAESVTSLMNTGVFGENTPVLGQNDPVSGPVCDMAPTIAAAKSAREQLQADLLATIRAYEDRYNLTVRNVNLNHSLMLGYPSRTCRVLVDVDL